MQMSCFDCCCVIEDILKQWKHMEMTSLYPYCHIKYEHLNLKGKSIVQIVGNIYL
jgi:hypothetical protein